MSLNYFNYFRLLLLFFFLLLLRNHRPQSVI